MRVFGFGLEVVGKCGGEVVEGVGVVGGVEE